MQIAANYMHGGWYVSVDEVSRGHRTLNSDLYTLCDPVELMTLDLYDVTEVKGHRTNVVCVSAARSLGLTAVVYWFELKLAESIVVNTLSDRQTHWTQAAVLYYDELELEAHCQYSLETVYCDNCIDISVQPVTEPRA